MSESERLPAPKQLMIVPLTEAEVAEMIERHIEFVDEDGRAVHLLVPFVKHYMQRDDGALPIITSIAQTPIVLYDGTILSGWRTDRRYGIVFRVPEELERLLPRREACTTTAVIEAMRFLMDEWLVDVAADYAGKCVIIACALTILERALLPMRPAFFITAGRRGNGKTTTINMVVMAATGVPASGAAWSWDTEERRKAVFSYLDYGLPVVVWDNIKRGSQITCPVIEETTTAEFYTDRVLGASQVKKVPAYTVQIFTGNNIAASGELASRVLTVRLNADRMDPENRAFKHADPVGWTDRYRGRILAALYTLLLGNPRRGRKPSELTPARTRFKEWWEMAGSAVEHAAEHHAAWCGGEGGATRIDLAELFLEGEDESEEDCSLRDVLSRLCTIFGVGVWFTAQELIPYVDTEAFGADEGAEELRHALEAAAQKSLPNVSSKTVTVRLRAITDNPVMIGADTFVLRRQVEHQAIRFRVEKVR
jgi:hypothetical protein